MAILTPSDRARIMLKQRAVYLADCRVKLTKAMETLQTVIKSGCPEWEVRGWEQQVQNWREEVSALEASMNELTDKLRPVFDPVSMNWKVPVEIDVAKGRFWTGSRQNQEIVNMPAAPMQNWSPADWKGLTFGVDPEVKEENKWQYSNGLQVTDVPSTPLNVDFFDQNGIPVESYRVRGSIKELRTDRVYFIWLDDRATPAQVKVLKDSLQAQGIKFIIQKGGNTASMVEIERMLDKAGIKIPVVKEEKESGEYGNTSSFTDSPRRRIRSVEESPEVKKNSLDPVAQEQGKDEKGVEEDGRQETSPAAREEVRETSSE